MSYNSVSLSCDHHSFSPLLPSLCSRRVKPAIFDLLLAVCIAAYLGTMYLAIQASQNSSSWNWSRLVAPAVCADVEHKWTFSPVLRCVHRTSASCTASSAGSPSPRRKRIRVQPPPLWYDLCSSDQRLEPVRIQMLCRAAFFFFSPSWSTNNDVRSCPAARRLLWPPGLV